MAKHEDKKDTCFDGESASGDFVRRVKPLEKLQGSVHEYHQPFEPVGISDWEAVLLEGLTPEKAHADELANPTMRELGQDPSD
ncbi:hypothetical protein [Halomonas sp. AOP43-F2-13]|uniref:hypothetical protein n=1 Tax=Halomonas sp. AOP43-F2-13 TaxID=3457657 RepID=UPI0040331602